MGRWWMVLVGALGIGLGLVLLPRPDTGLDPSPPPPTAPTAQVQPTPDRPAEALPARARPEQAGQVNRPPIDEGVERGGERELRGPNPYAARARERRDTPEAHTATAAIPGWNHAIRATQNLDHGDAEWIREEARALVQELILVRRNPHDQDWEDLEVRQRTLLDRIAQTPYANDPEMAQATGRIREALDNHGHNETAR